MSEKIFENDSVAVWLDERDGDVIEVCTLGDGGHANGGESGKDRWGMRVDVE